MARSERQDEGRKIGRDRSDVSELGWSELSFEWSQLSIPFNLFTPKLKSTFSQPSKEKCINKVVRIGSIIIFQSE